MSLSEEKLDELKKFTQLIRSNPKLLERSDLAFFKQFIIDMGKHVRPLIQEVVEEKKKTSNPESNEKAVSGKQEEPKEQEPTEEDLELMDDMGEKTKVICQEEAQEANAKGLEAFQKGDFKRAAIFFGRAIVKGGGRSALYFARRGEALLKLDKPLSARRDASHAIKLNPDIGKAYKVRGLAHMKLENYEDAVKDLRMANQIDFDAVINEELKKAEKLLEEAKKQKATTSPTSKPQTTPQSSTTTKTTITTKPAASSSTANEKNPSWLTPGLFEKVTQDPVLCKAFQDPKIIQAVNEIATNPHAFLKYKDDPEILMVFQKFSKLVGGAAK